MALYSSVEITCSKDISHLLLCNHHDSFQSLELHDLYKSMSYFSFGVSNVLQTPADVANCLSVRDVWAYAHDDDDVVGGLKRLRLDWIDAFYSALDATIASSMPKEFYVLGHEHFPSAYFIHDEHDQDVCIFRGVSSVFFDTLISYGASPLVISIDKKSSRNVSHYFKKLGDGINIACYSRLCVFAAAAALVEYTSPPQLSTKKQCSRVPQIFADFLFENATQRYIRWSDISLNKNDRSDPSKQKHRYTGTGFITSTKLEHILQLASKAVASLDMAAASVPLEVPLNARDVFDAGSTAPPEPVVATARPSKPMKNPFSIVATAAPRLEPLTAKAVSETTLEGDYVSLKCTPHDTTFVFGYASQVAQGFTCAIDYSVAGSLHSTMEWSACRDIRADSGSQGTALPVATLTKKRAWKQDDDGDGEQLMNHSVEGTVVTAR